MCGPRDPDRRQHCGSGALSIQHGGLANVGARYFERNNMELTNGWIVKQCGSDNARGLFKFEMFHARAIYLHDTSSSELFDSSQRHSSHGCARVEDALGSAQLLAEDKGMSVEWQSAQLAGDEQFLPLNTPSPVRLMYRNVFVEEGGKVAFRTDPYGWNEPIARALGFAAGEGAQLRGEKPDISP